MHKRRAWYERGQVQQIECHALPFDIRFSGNQVSDYRIHLSVLVWLHLFGTSRLNFGFNRQNGSWISNSLSLDISEIFAKAQISELYDRLANSCIDMDTMDGSTPLHWRNSTILTLTCLKHRRVRTFRKPLNVSRIVALDGFSPAHAAACRR